MPKIQTSEPPWASAYLKAIQIDWVVGAPLTPFNQNEGWMHPGPPLLYTPYADLMRDGSQPPQQLANNGFR
jgi:hypothetical protein